MTSVVGAVLFILVLIHILATGDIKLRMKQIFDPRGVQEWMEVKQRQVARHIFRFVTKLTGFRIEVEPFSEGSLPRSFLIVSNHQSLADIPVLIFAFRRRSLRFVTKRELGRGIPLISPVLKKAGHALISRSGDYGVGMRELVRLAGISVNGICPVVFPEGTRSRSGALRRFHAGAFRIILGNAKLPVLSVAVDGGYTISRLAKVFTSLGKTRYRVKPIRLYPAPSGKQETLALLTKIEGDISSKIGEWRTTA
jgi:1-acyl-sn-glycerol-3-phosphate acyltransferase